MSCVYPTLEKRIVIALFIHMGMSCRKIDTYLGRSHTGVCLELRQDSSKSGYCARAADCRVQTRRKMPRHDHRMSPSNLIAWADEKHCRDWPPERIAGPLRLDYPEDQSMHIRGRASTAGTMPLSSLVVPAIVICVVPSGATGGKGGYGWQTPVARAERHRRTVAACCRECPPWRTGRRIWSAPPGARQRCSAVRSAKGAFCCRPG